MAKKKKEKEKKAQKPVFRFSEGIPGPEDDKSPVKETAAAKEVSPATTVPEEEEAKEVAVKEEAIQEEPKEKPLVQPEEKKEAIVEEPVGKEQRLGKKDAAEDKKSPSPAREGKELAKFEEALKQYHDELRIRPKKELVANVPVPLPIPVYQKLKQLEPYFTRKQRGFIQKVITDATIKEVKRLIEEVETKKLKKLK